MSNDKRNNTRARVWINQVDEETAPPSQPVLGVEVIGDIIALTVATYEETVDSESYTTISEVMVDGTTLLKAITASTDKHNLLFALQLPQAAIDMVMSRITSAIPDLREARRG